MRPRNHGARHDALVAELVSDLQPARRIWSPWTRLTGWIGLAVGGVAFAATVGLRDDLGTALAEPRFLLDLAILLAGAGLAATAALLAAVPGRIGGHEARRIAFGLLVLAVVAALLGEPTGVTTWPSFVLLGLRCAVCVAAFGLVPGIALFWAVARGAPVHGRTAALCVGTAAFLVGAASVRVACPIDDVLHLAVWHGLPVVLWAVGTMTIGGAWLTRWLASRP